MINVQKALQLLDKTEFLPELLNCMVCDFTSPFSVQERGGTRQVLAEWLTQPVTKRGEKENQGASTNIYLILTMCQGLR